MDRASKAIRRSGVRLKALGGGHADLSMLISELKDVRQAAKIFMQAQNTASQDMVKWSLNDENRAIQDVTSQLAELNSLWTEVQKEFSEQMKDYKYQFEMILEGERHVDQARNHLSSCEQREMKIKKELKKASKVRLTQEEIRQLEVKLLQAESAKDLAQLEVIDRLRENESLKMMRFKQGLMKISEAYVELANKCAIIFGAQMDISCHIPDIEGQDLHEIKYTGSGITKQAVVKARDRVRQYRHRGDHLLHRPMPSMEEPPPPYTVDYCVCDAEVNDPTYIPGGGGGGGAGNDDDEEEGDDCALYGQLGRSHHYVFNALYPRPRSLANHPINTRQPQQQVVQQTGVRPCPGEDDILWNHRRSNVNDYEDEISGAMGGTRI